MMDWRTRERILDVLAGILFYGALLAAAASVLMLLVLVTMSFAR